MGNCSSSKQQAEDGGSYIGFEKSNNGSRKNSFAANNVPFSKQPLRDPFSTEPTEHETTSSDVGDATAPMSPEFPTLSPPPPEQSPRRNNKTSASPSPSAYILTTPRSSSPNSSKGDAFERRLMEAEADDLVSPLSTEFSSPRRPSRAFQARVQKAKHLQMAFNNSNNSNHRRSNSGTSSTTSRRSSWSSAGSSSLDPQQAQQRGGSSSHSLASSSARSVASSIASTEDDGGAATANSIREATAWAELELDGSVLCTAMSRTVHPSSSSSSAPPLYVAVGTVSGSVVVQELLVHDENVGLLSHLPDSRTEAGRNANVSMDAASHAKLGPPVSVQLDGSVRSLDFSPDGQYLAVGGDDCQCRIYRLDCAAVDSNEE